MTTDIRILHVRPAPAPGALCVYCPEEAEYTCVVCEADVCWEHGHFSRQADEAFCEETVLCHRRQQASLERGTP